MLPHLSLVAVVILAAILWLTRLEEKRSRHQSSIKLEGIWTGAERRSEERLQTALSVFYASSQNSRVGSSNSTNVSGGGIQLVLPEKFPLGAELDLEFSVSERERPFRIVGQVVWMSEIPPEEGIRLFRTGLRFVKMDRKEAERLKRSLYEKEGN